MKTDQNPKDLQRHLFWFAALLALCLAAAAGIFVGLAGVETGETIIAGFMTALVENAAWILALFIVFNLALVVWYRRNHHRQKEG